MHLPTSEADFEASLERGAEVLWRNGYPGRWLAMGRGEGIHAGEFFLAYSFGGRSDESKGRTAIQEGNAVRLVAPGMSPEEMAQVPDAALIYYPASDTKSGVFVTSNGAQTRPVLDAVVEGRSFEEAVTNAPKVKGMMDGKEIEIDLSSFEPDKLNTPRITGIVDLLFGDEKQFGLAVVRKNLETGEPDRSFYTANLEDIEPGQGWAIQTYGVNDPLDRETPVPPFSQEPYGFSMEGDSTAIAQRVRKAIGKQTFAAAVVRVINISQREFSGSTIINTRG